MSAFSLSFVKSYVEWVAGAPFCWYGWSWMAEHAVRKSSAYWWFMHKLFYFSVSKNLKKKCFATFCVEISSHPNFQGRVKCRCTWM